MGDSIPAIYCLRGEGRYYVCEMGSRFVGCCKRNPCHTGCEDENLLPTYFNTSVYGKFPDLDCDSGLFYTCTQSKPDGYSGCCRVNACQVKDGTGCPPEDVSGAYLPDNPEDASYYLELNVTSRPRRLNSTHLSEPTKPLAREATAISRHIPAFTIAAFVVLMLGVAISIAAVMPCLSRLIRSKMTWRKASASDK